MRHVDELNAGSVAHRRVGSRCKTRYATDTGARNLRPLVFLSGRTQSRVRLWSSESLRELAAEVSVEGEGVDVISGVTDSRERPLRDRARNLRRRVFARGA